MKKIESTIFNSKYPVIVTLQNINDLHFDYTELEQSGIMKIQYYDIDEDIKNELITYIGKSDTDCIALMEIKIDGQYYNDDENPILDYNLTINYGKISVASSYTKEELKWIKDI